MLQNYIEAGNKIDTAFVFFTPFSFLNNLDQVFTYNYFIKPFYRDENLALMTPLVKQQVSKIPFSSMAFYPLILTSNWTPDYTSDDPVNYTILSPISIVYMHKMSALAKANNFKLVLVSAPLSVKKKKEVEMLNRREISENQLQQEFEGFFESIVYLDESNFVDGIHLKHPEQFKGRYKNLIH